MLRAYSERTWPCLLRADCSKCQRRRQDAMYTATYLWMQAIWRIYGGTSTRTHLNDDVGLASCDLAAALLQSTCAEFGLPYSEEGFVRVV